MTTGYIIEVAIPTVLGTPMIAAIPGRTEYLITGGNTSHYPKVFTNAGHAKRAIYANQNASYKRIDKDRITVIRIELLEAGLRKSHATNFKCDEFLAREFNKSKPSIPNNKNAVYKIRLGSFDFSSAGAAHYAATSATRTNRHGKTWNTAGNLRSHISGNIRRYLYQNYANATVLEIEMDKDGITPKVVKSYPIVDFYCASPDCRKNHDSAFPTKKYTPSVNSF